MNNPGITNVDAKTFSAKQSRSKSTQYGTAREMYFIAWDGEGITPEPDEPQQYVLFGSSTGDYIQVSHGRLSPTDCLDLILRVGQEHKRYAYHVAFAFNYDVNMICADMPVSVVERLYRDNLVRWGKYRIEWLPGKYFQVTANKRTVCIWDAFSFFGTSLVKALESYNVGTEEENRIVREGKQSRNAFRYDEIDSLVKPYWRVELQLFVKLMNSLRGHLADAGKLPNKFYGPGVLANDDFVKHGISDVMPLREYDDPEFQRATQQGFAGGKFELYATGRHVGPVYEYDINSAYPNIIRNLPDLANSVWEYVANPTIGSVSDIRDYSLYYVTYRSRDFVQPNALFRRDSRGKVDYPTTVQRWTWGVELRAAVDTGAYASVSAAYIFHDSGARPFKWVENDYLQRLEWKHEGIPAQVAIKLSLNSMYGKFAQRVGWNKEKNLPPRWHCLEWAGFITASTRAQIQYASYAAYMANSLVSVETDAVFTTSPLLDDYLELGEHLGQWDRLEFSGITILQNGVYWLDNGDGSVTHKVRGLSSASLPYETVLETISDNTYPELHLNPMIGNAHRFVGIGRALNTNISEWLKWVDDKIQVKPGGDKRTHRASLCNVCQGEDRNLGDGLHTLINKPVKGEGNSFSHHLPWVNSETSEFETFKDRNGIEYV